MTSRPKCNTYGHVFDELEDAEPASAEDLIATHVRPWCDLCTTERWLPSKQKLRLSGAFLRADARTRTGDPFITSEVLYQLSYVGRGSNCTAIVARFRAAAATYLPSLPLPFPLPPPGAPVCPFFFS
jgi:hypothetical protein